MTEPMFIVGLLTGCLISTMAFVAGRMRSPRDTKFDVSDLTPDELEHLIALQAKIRVR